MVAFVFIVFCMHHVHIRLVLQGKTCDGYTSATDWKRLRRDVSAVTESHKLGKPTGYLQQNGHWINSFSEIRVAEQPQKL